MDTVAPSNADQVEYWNGDAALRWVRGQERMDRAFRQFTEFLIERAAPRPGERAIDVGCGCGDLSLAVADRVVPGGRVLGVDVSRPMLSQARSRAQARPENAPAIEWQETDAASLSLPEAAFDLLISRFGVMFFADPVAAFRNLRLGLRPEGRLVMLCWRPLQENAWVSVPRAAMLQVVPTPAAASPNAPGPFAFGDAARVGAILADAGFTHVQSVPIDAPLEVLSAPGLTADEALDEVVRFAVEAGPASALLRDVDEPTRTRAVQAVRETLRARAGRDRPSLDAACWVYSAVNSGSAVPA